MSGDESDPEHDPDLSRDKVPTQLILPWLNPEITHVFARLDGKKPRGHLIAPRGNRSFTRNEDRKTAPSDLCHPVRKLPTNWYHPDWLLNLSEANKLQLSATEAVPIPVSPRVSLHH